MDFPLEEEADLFAADSILAFFRREELSVSELGSDFSLPRGFGFGGSLP